jgi:hypothetical protein
MTDTRLPPDADIDALFGEPLPTSILACKERLLSSVQVRNLMTLMKGKPIVKFLIDDVRAAPDDMTLDQFREIMRQGRASIAIKVDDGSGAPPGERIH